MTARLLKLWFALAALLFLAAPLSADQPPVPKNIKSYDFDFNWGPGGPNGFARPGLWADPDPAQHVAWYKALGVNAIQTFCVSCNGYLDWLRMPTSRASNGGRWLDCEKKLYAQLMHEDFPGEKRLSAAKQTEYGRRAVGRCWDTIRRAAKKANPNCLVWLTCCDVNDPHIVNSRAFHGVSADAEWTKDGRFVEPPSSNVIPKPSTMEPLPGSMTLDAGTVRIYSDLAAKAEAETLAACLRPATGLPLRVQPQGAFGNQFRKTDGSLNDSLFSDGLHPNSLGYELLSRLLAEQLASR